MILLILIGIVTFLIWKLHKHYNYWTYRGIKQNQQFYFLGDNVNVFLKKESFYDMIIRLYLQFSEERYFGMFQGTQASLCIRDPELIKQITVKEFDHFLNHSSLVPVIDPLWSKNLFVLRDTTWREMRSTLSPSFTANKMKIIFSLVSECANEYLGYFLRSQETTDIELTETFTRYTNDVIATVAFGIKCNSIDDKNNEFYTMGKKITTFDFMKVMRFFILLMAPSFCKLIKLKLMSEEISHFFIKVIKDSIHMRETQGIIRPDMIHLLLEARKGRKLDEVPNIVDIGFATVKESDVHNTDSIKQELSDMDIAAQALVFFVAGFDTVSTVIAFMGYELAVNSDVQQKLQQEIDDTVKECNGRLTYEALLKMKYMDMVVSETLRKWPPTPITDRICTKPFTINPVKDNEKPIHLKPGDIIILPVNGIHRDPHYYPNPDVFDPERFNDENKGDIKPYTYLPFGLGPRSCIGSRLAIIEIKTIFFYMLSRFNFIATEKTQIPIVISKNSFNVTGEKGMWIGLESRIK